MIILRRRGSSQVGGKLTCPACGSDKLRFIETQGRDLDIYKCKRCNTPIRYMTTPMTQGEFMDIKHGGRVARGINPREVTQLGKKVNLPGLGNFNIRKA